MTEVKIIITQEQIDAWPYKDIDSIRAFKTPINSAIKTQFSTSTWSLVGRLAPYFKVMFPDHHSEMWDIKEQDAFMQFYEDWMRGHAIPSKFTAVQVSTTKPFVPSNKPPRRYGNDTFTRREGHD